MRLWNFDELPIIKNLNIAVVGHIEWVTFLQVDQQPKSGLISHGEIYKELPAGGGHPHGLLPVVRGQTHAGRPVSRHRRGGGGGGEGVRPQTRGCDENVAGPESSFGKSGIVGKIWHSDDD